MTEMTETKKVEVPEGFMTGKFPLKKRAYGEEQPGIKVGPFKIRLPLIHHEWSWTEMAAAMFLGVACLGAGVTTTMTTFGLDDPAIIAALGFDENGVFLMALTFGVLNAICYSLPSLLGDRDASFVKQTRRIAVILTLPVAAMVSLLFFFFSNQEMLFLSSAVVGLFGGSVFLYYRS